MKPQIQNVKKMFNFQAFKKIQKHLSIKLRKPNKSLNVQLPEKLAYKKKSTFLYRPKMLLF
jgi:hypothetical protein